MKKIVFFFSLAFLLVACDKFSGSELDEQQKKWDEVMVVHDDVMPKMGAITHTHKLLKTVVIDSTMTDLMTQRSKAMSDLQNAEELMWVWMNDLKQLKPMREAKTHQQIMAYLEEQMVSITKVKEDMENSIEKGKALLSSLNIDDTITEEKNELHK